MVLAKSQVHSSIYNAYLDVNDRIYPISHVAR